MDRGDRREPIFRASADRQYFRSTYKPALHYPLPSQGVFPYYLPSWSSPEKVDAASAEGLLVSLDGDFGFENDD
jgi:hypothetical protein